MDDFSKEKVKQFIRDKGMSNAVHSVILKTFLEKREGDTQTKAAQRLAIDFLIESWENLEKINTLASTETKERVQKAL